MRVDYNEAVKLIVLLQATIEKMDEFKGTNLYRQDIRNSMNNLNTKVERHIRPQLQAIDEQEEISTIFDQVKGRIEMIVDLPLTTLINSQDEENEVQHTWE